MTPESKCSQHEDRSKIGNIFVYEKMLEEYSVKIYKIDPYFCEWRENVLFRIDFLFLNIF